MGGFAGGAEQGSPSQAVELTSRTNTPQLVATASADEFHVALDRCEFPGFVWTPPEGRINLANQAAAELFNVPLERLVGGRVFDYIGPRDAIERSAGVLASGEADSLSGRRSVRRNELGEVPVQFWTRVIELDGQRRIVALLLPNGELTKLGRDPNSPWRDLMSIAAGLADQGWLIIEVSADVFNIVGLAPDDLIGTDLLQLFSSDDLPTIRKSERRSEAVDLRHLRLANHEDNGDEMSLMVAPCEKPSNSVIFAIVGGPRCDEESMANRIDDLEMRLRRIAAELRAAGVLDAVDALPFIEEHPKLGELTTRQWEVLSLLMKGQRVATIASNLFVSQSTVRNHLASIFQKFDVHSQAELLALLARRPGANRD
jgi:DNA-binding CsgD family transcriptional regulator